MADDDFLKVQFSVSDEFGKMIETTDEEEAKKAGIFNGKAKYGYSLVMLSDGRMVRGFRAALLAAKERQNQALLAAAAQFQGAGQPAGLTGPPAGPQPADQGTALGPGELLDESLPGAGGGANPMAMR